MASDQMPVLFISHGAGPAWLYSADDTDRLRELDKDSPSAKFMKELPNILQLPRPKAVLVISAHWEVEEFTVNTGTKHELLYDYTGFPPETYNLKWKPEGDPDVASEVKKLVEKAGLVCKETSTTPLDHGVFIPLMFLFPESDIPCVELSIRKDMNMRDHLLLGESLRPLRKAGVLIVGSGFTTHQSSKPPVPEWVKEFGEYVHDIIGNDLYLAQERKEKLSYIVQHQNFLKAHPTSDHFIPLPVAVAAAGYSPGEKLYEEYVLGTLLISHFVFRE